jgi:hypothetical protein
MSHEITELDSVLVPEGSKYRAWHGLEKPVGDCITLADVREVTASHWPMSASMACILASSREP